MLRTLVVGIGLFIGPGSGFAAEANTYDNHGGLGPLRGPTMAVAIAVG
jgi:hypothetical protein